jgi:two-component system, cell cycle sensor histidine kinase and response regulator CckA
MVYVGEETEILKPVDIAGIVKDMLELLEVSVSKHVTVETDFGGSLRAVRANPSQIRQVIMNLFSNASEAIGPRDGVIRVATRQVTVSRDSPLATSEAIAAGDYVQLEIFDSGRGMSPAVQARIFDPFFTTKETGNHGLGLVTVRDIVERLHGTIRLSSAPGKGTTFQILLPSEATVATATPSRIAGSGGETLASRGLTVLIVEDEELLRDAVSKMLRMRGMSVIEASDGLAALNMIRGSKVEHHIDVLFLDITLPGASSREVYEEARRLRPGLPVIVTSAKSKEAAAASLATEVERFLRKPFSLGDLVDMIRQTLPS